jgi:hypothetical protein
MHHDSNDAITLPECYIPSGLFWLGQMNSTDKNLFLISYLNSMVRMRKSNSTRNIQHRSLRSIVEEKRSSNTFKSTRTLESHSFPTKLATTEVLSTCHEWTKNQKSWADLGIDPGGSGVSW